MNSREIKRLEKLALERGGSVIGTRRPVTIIDRLAKGSNGPALRGAGRHIVFRDGQKLDKAIYIKH